MSHCRLCGCYASECACEEDCVAFTPTLDTSLNLTTVLQNATAKSLCELQLSSFNVRQALAKFKERVVQLSSDVSVLLQTEIQEAAKTFLDSGEWLPEDNPPFVTKPWSLNASALKDESYLSEAFGFQAQERSLTNLPSVIVDKLLGNHFKSPRAMVNGLNLDVNAINDEDRVIPVFVKPDGTWKCDEVTFVLEIKTVKNAALISKHMEDYLRQIAAYQLLQYEDPDNTPEMRYLLVCIVLDKKQKPEMLALEVLFQNLVDCAKEWKRWFRKLSHQSYKVDRLITQHKHPISIKLIENEVKALDEELEQIRKVEEEAARLEAEALARKQAAKKEKKNAKQVPVTNNPFSVLR